MSLTQTAFLEKASVPDRAQLQGAITALGFDLTVDDFYRPFSCSGFLPCVLKGKKSGFEIYFESSSEADAGFPHLEKEIGQRDCAITFRWGGDMAECVCVLMVSAALAKNFSAVVHYPDDDILYSTDQLLSEVAGSMKYLK
jgi:hypothetical protein